MCRTHSLLIAVLCHLVVCLSGEEFTNKDTDQTWTIPDVSYPDPTFIHNIVPTVSNHNINIGTYIDFTF